MVLDGPSKNPACGSAAMHRARVDTSVGAQVGEGVQWKDRLIICLAEYSVSPTVEGVLAGSPECGWHAGVGAPRRQQYRRHCHLRCGGSRVGLADDHSPGGEPGRLPVRVVLGRREAKLPSPWLAE